MDPVQRAIWLIENNFREALSLAAVAERLSLSKFHLVRMFGLRTGHSVDGYIRARRLSEAAKQLADGHADIVEVALSFGYGSHEAFTRAFGRQFGQTPDSVRKARSLNTLALVEPFAMDNETLNHPGDPKILNGRAMLIVGVKRRYSAETSAAIPAQWQAFIPYIGYVPHQRGDATFGVLCDNDDAGNIDYVTGVEVELIADLPPGLEGLGIAAQTYAVFEHVGHASTVRRTWMGIFEKWLPESGKRLVDAPQIERYAERFDPHSGDGVIEIWLPIRSGEGSR